MSHVDETRANNTKPATGAVRSVGTPVSRRSFLGISGLGALAVTVTPAVSLLATPTGLCAQDFTVLGDGIGRTLLRMARDIYPHDRIPDKYYAIVLQPYDGKAASDVGFGRLIAEGVANLDSAAVKQFGKRYAEITGEGDRVNLLYGIEQTEFFQKIRGDLMAQLYNNKAVWPLFGYEGSSWEKGGYLYRGFDDIDWLGSV